MAIEERFETEAGLKIFYLDHIPAKVSAFLIWSDDVGACVAINVAHELFDTSSNAISAGIRFAWAAGCVRGQAASAKRSSSYDAHRHQRT